MSMVPVADDMKVELLASSISPEGVRLDTFKLRYWRAIHSELMTHRLFSRNASSSRAIPVSKLSEQPILFPDFRENQPGMQPGAPLSGAKAIRARQLWEEAARACLAAAGAMSIKDGPNVHKQYANRMLEWFGSIEVVVSSTEWANFFALRDHEDAQEQIRLLAQGMKHEYTCADPVQLGYGEWHLPFIRPEDDELVQEFLAGLDYDLNAEAAWGNRGPTLEMFDAAEFAFRDLPASMDPEIKVKLVISAARCARASYMNFRGDTEIGQDYATFMKLVGSQPVHASPLEHQARPASSAEGGWRCGNFVGWQQFRKFVPGEAHFDR